ncbi:hypothetical protein RA278_30865, partial [Pseudomonas syringae pv. tagetis]
TQSIYSHKTNLALHNNTTHNIAALNAHISGGVVLAGELVILGDASTPSSTPQQAFLMAKAAQVHTALLVNRADRD